MTESEAIGIIKTGSRKTEEYYAALDMAIDALEKQIPKRVICLPKNNAHKSRYCPRCGGEIFDHNYLATRCKCGQRLQWRLRND